MLSKLLQVSACLSLSQGVKIYLNNQSSTQAFVKGVQQTCSANLDRLKNSKAVKDFSSYSNGDTNYVDTEFPADTSSLYWENHVADWDAVNTYKSEVKGWKRIYDISDDWPSLWGEKGVNPRGTSQGQLGDCWFLAAASALAEKPERVKKIFTNTDWDSAGIFEVTFYQLGQPVKVVVDDLIPINSNGTPVNAQKSENGAWWQVILEKAYAKYYINYAQLTGGVSDRAFRDMTNMPIYSNNVSNQSDGAFLKVINDAKTKGWAMVAACMNANNFSLPTFHVFTMLGTHTLSNGVKLVQMRNPHAKEYYTGPYRDDDPVWTPALKAEVNLKPGNDGLFWIPMENFRQAFTWYHIAMYQDWYTSTVAIKQTGSEFKVYFHPEATGDVIVYMEYTNKRQVPEGCATPKVNYKMYLNDSAWGTQIPAFSQTGYMKFQSGPDWGHDVITIKNEGDASGIADIGLTAYSDKGKVTLSLTPTN